MSSRPDEAVDARDLVRDLVARDGQTLAEQAGVALDGSPDSLWQLLVVSQLLGARISSSAALATARELWRCGWSSPGAMAASTASQRVAALGRGGYRRYDLSTAPRLVANAERVLRRWSGDLNGLGVEAGWSPGTAALLLQEFDGVGPVGASIFLREVQEVWPRLGPCVDALVLKGTQRVGLPADGDALARLAGDDMVRLCAALARAGRRRG